LKCQIDIIAIADEKLKSADILVDTGQYDNAYYLAGYSVELLLKARVCKTLGVDDFFEFKKISKKELYKPYKVHNFSELLLLSGIYTDFENELKDVTFKGIWSVINTWTEDERYTIGKPEADTKHFVTSIKQFSAWIKSHL